MKRKKFLKLLILSSAMLTSGLIAGNLKDNVTISRADGGGTVISEDGLTKTFTPTSSTVAEIAKNTFYYDATDGIYFQVLSSSWKPSNKFQKMNVYIEVPRNASGTAYVKANGRNDARFMYFYKDGAIDSTKSFAYDKAENSNTFTTEDLSVFTINNEEKYFLGFCADGTDFKADYFRIVLTTGSFFGTPKYDVNYYNSDGTEMYSSLTEQVWESENPTVNPTIPNEIGKVFLGWSDTVNGTNIVDPTTYTATGNMNFYAVWEEIATYTITFNDYEGATPRTVTMNAGPLVGLEDPAPREGSEFLGWYTTPTFDEGTQVTVETVLSDDLTLYGKWQEATYVYVTFEGITDSYRTFEGRTLDSWPSDPVAEGKVFAGWFDANGNQYTSTSTFNEDTSLFAKWNLILNVSYAFDDYGTLPPEKDPDFTLVSNDVIEIKTYGYNKQGATDVVTYGEKSYTNYAQAKGLTIKLAYNATIEVICSQTSATHTRKMMVMDKEGRVYNLDEIPVPKKESGAITINLLAGEYTVLTTEGSYNFYGVNVDYTNSETITSDLDGLKSTKLNNQAGYDANHNESMRFVGEIDYTDVSEISTIHLSVSSTKLVDNVETPESVFDGYIYTVYDRVTLTEGAKYGVVENRLYFYYIVDGLDDTYNTVTCNATINLTDGTVYNLNSVFDYKVSFGK